MDHMHQAYNNSPWQTPPHSGVENMSIGMETGHGSNMDSCGGLLEPLAELHDSQFEPQTRARSNTWPLPRPENYVEPVDDTGSNKCSNQQLSIGGLPVPSPVSLTIKKNSSRRNAWGNLSYADLITQAITSATENRLTLSQIYEWMVQNVPYFKDKGDSNSSAGWKNSIRHNLSLHNRFMRVQNEGTGKSSWWMINPDAKPGKSVRRRAASMETSKFEKRRGRVKKKVEALRNSAAADATPSPSSSVSEGLDLFPDSPVHNAGFQLSPDFRQRASSNASSCGRLSPIPAVLGVEPDWSTPSPYPSSEYTGGTPGGLDQLAGTLADGMKLQTDYMQGYVTNQGVPQQPPPPYQSPYSMHAASPYGLHQCPMHRLQPCGCINQQCHPRESMSPSSGTGMSPSYPQSEPSPDPLGSSYMRNSCGLNRPPSNSPPLTPQPLMISAQDQHIHHSGHTAAINSNNGQTGNSPSTMMGQLMGALNSGILDDLSLNIESLQGGFDCNVDEVIKHELSMDGTLDFNFPSSASHLSHHSTMSATESLPGASPQQSSQYSPSVTPPSWVH